MIYFFINIIMYLIIIMILVKYLKNNINIFTFIIILFNMNTSFVFIYQNVNFIYELLVLIISLIIYYFINLFNKVDEEIVLIKDGNINFHELVNNYSYHKLIRYLKIHHLKLNEITYCIKKGSRLVIIKNKNTSYPVSLIIDGKIINDNLRLIKKEETWLRNELNKRNMPINNIDYAYYKNNNVYFINNV